MDIKFFEALFLIYLSSINICHGKDVAMVFGYQNATDIELWRQKQIGFGVKNLLQQALLDNTDFSLFDEKIVVEVGKESINGQLQGSWLLNDQQTTTLALKGLATEHHINHLFWVKIVDFDSTVFNFSLGFFSSSEYKDTLMLEVCHYALATNVTVCDEGSATQSRTLNSVFYKPNEKVSFIESGAGRLSQEAINKSLTKLLHHEQ